MGSFRFNCPCCQSHFTCKDEYVGMETSCPNCHQKNVISRPPSAPPQAAYQQQQPPQQQAAYQQQQQFNYQQPQANYAPPPPPPPPQNSYAPPYGEPPAPQYSGRQEESGYRLSFAAVVSLSIENIARNFVSVFCAVLLWLLTLWVPMLNIGATIGICTIPVLLAQRQLILPTAIFSAQFRRKMGNFLLGLGLFGLGINAGIAIIVPLLFITGIVSLVMMISHSGNPLPVVLGILAVLGGIVPLIALYIAWSQALFILVERDINPVEALHLSSKITEGGKLTIFMVYFLWSVAALILAGLIFLIPGATAKIILLLAWFIGTSVVNCCIAGAIYAHLAPRLDAMTSGQK